MLIDLRSDTLTLPTDDMRRAMMVADVGDDVYGEDPTVNLLEREAAARMGFESALLMPTGSMANLCACITYCRRGSRVICGDQSHLFHYEAGAVSALAGLIYHPITNTPDGGLALSALEEVLVSHDESGSNCHIPPVGLLALESSHNRCGGVAPTLESLGAAAAFARRRGIPVHLDGARIFNAALALGLPVHRLAATADSVQFCLSKGLAAPVGSVLAGSAPFIREARRVRKLLGGGMRQAGIIAAAGLVALRTMVDRLAEDHALAARLAAGIESVAREALDVRPPQTNIVLFRSRSPGLTHPALVTALREQGVIMGTLGPWIRAVTRLGIGRAEIDGAIERFARVMAQQRGKGQRPDAGTMPQNA